MNFTIQFAWYIYPLQGKNNCAVTERFLLLIYYDAALLKEYTIKTGSLKCS